jgi:phosphatidylglycerophosphatase A
MRFREKLVMFLATGGFVGNIPFAPGTFGSLVAIPLCYLLSKINLSLALFAAVLIIFLAIWIAQAAETILKKKDPGSIVIDEIAGMVVTFIDMPFHPATVVSGFLIFRVLDITKPFPIRTLERRLAGGSGVVLDDVMAGIYSNLLLHLGLYLFDKW